MGAHPASYTMGTGSFPGVKRSGRGADHPPPSKCRGHERVGLYLYSPSGPQWPVIGENHICIYVCVCVCIGSTFGSLSCLCAISKSVSNKN